MTRKLMTAITIMALAAAVASAALFRTEMAAAEANTASPVVGVCDGQFVKNVKVRALGRSDFEVTWEFAPVDPCLQAQSFAVEVRAKRKVGGAILGKEVLSVGGGERRAIAKFRSLIGFDKVEATVTASITIKPFGQAFLDL
ncbi:MAG TPA: hypothetical protein VNO14_08235 [Blastocatellia bacterium]|nr:hypothetical protein [Blastocatellia bacterium]